MAGRKPFTPQSLGDPRLDRLQEAIAAKLQELDDAVATLASPLVLPTARDAQVTDQVLVDYRGPGGHTIRLPAAAARGKGRASFVHILNNGLGSVNVAAIGKDTVNGGRVVALAAASAFLGMSNGDSAWSSVRTEAAPAAPSISANWYSPVDSAAYFFGLNPANVTNNAGNFTTGDKFSSSRALVCTGVRFFWKSPGSNKSVRCRIYEGAVSVANALVSVSASGIYEGIFATPLPLSAYRDYAATTYETGGTGFTRIDSSGGAPFGGEPIVGMIPTGPFTIGRSFKRFEAGDSVPTGTNSTSFYPVEPIFAPYSLE